MKQLLLLISVVAALGTVSAQEKLPRELCLEYASILTNYPKALRATPIPTRPDLSKPVAVRYEGFGGLVLPETKLSVETIAKAGNEASALGQLWLVRLAPMQAEQAVPASKLHMVHITHGETELDVACCALGVRKAGAERELLVYGKSPEPVLRVPLKAVVVKQEDPVDITAERNGDTGTITLTFAGKYQATFAVAPVD